MDLSTNIRQYKFIKEPTGQWFIDLPDWTGGKADLQMVAGADTMLDYVGEGNKEVELLLSEMPFEGSYILELMHDYGKETGGGGIYLLQEYEGDMINQEMWLCEVTEWVFGRLPEVIYFKKV